MNALPPRNHNSPPDPIDQIAAQFEPWRLEAENWLDGEAVESEDQMRAVDALRDAMRKCRLALEAGQKSESAPLYDAYKAALSRWKPTIEDTQRIEKGLVAIVDGFKRRLAAEKAAAERAAREEAARARRAAEDAARAADVTNIEAQRAAAEAQAAAELAQAQLAAASKDKVRNMRTVTLFEVTDHRALLRWIAANRREDITAFLDAWAERNHKAVPDASGLRVWTEKRAV
jgi:hypothetical protein